MTPAGFRPAFRVFISRCGSNMRSNNKTPKGAFKAAQLKYKRQQALFDAIKLAKQTGESFATFHGKRFKLVAPSLQVQPLGFVLLRGRVRLCMIIDKDGLKALPINKFGEAKSSMVHISGEQLLCDAIEL